MHLQELLHFSRLRAEFSALLGIWNSDAIGKQLADFDARAVRRAYTRREYLEERVRMMQHWSDYLDELRGGAQIPRPDFGRRGGG